MLYLQSSLAGVVSAPVDLSAFGDIFLESTDWYIGQIDNSTTVSSVNCLYMVNSDMDGYALEIKKDDSKVRFNKSITYLEGQNNNDRLKISTTGLDVFDGTIDNVNEINSSGALTIDSASSNNLLLQSKTGPRILALNNTDPSSLTLCNSLLDMKLHTIQNVDILTANEIKNISTNLDISTSGANQINVTAGGDLNILSDLDMKTNEIKACDKIAVSTINDTGATLNIDTIPSSNDIEIDSGGLLALNATGNINIGNSSIGGTLNYGTGGTSKTLNMSKAGHTFNIRSDVDFQDKFITSLSRINNLRITGSIFSRIGTMDKDANNTTAVDMFAGTTLYGSLALDHTHSDFLGSAYKIMFYGYLDSGDKEDIEYELLINGTTVFLSVGDPEFPDTSNQTFGVESCFTVIIQATGVSGQVLVAHNHLTMKSITENNGRTLCEAPQTTSIDLSSAATLSGTFRYTSTGNSTYTIKHILIEKVA